MSTKDPAFLFYASDFLTGVSDLTMEERGQYITMMCIQHQKGVVSSKWLSINLPDASTDVLSKFVLDDEGNYCQKRLNTEMVKREKHLPYKIASATLGGLISSHKVKKDISLKIKEAFDITEFADLSKNEVKQKVSEWFKHMLNYFENDNVNNNTVSSLLNNKAEKIEKNVALKSFEESGCQFSDQFFKNWEELCLMPKWKKKPYKAILKNIQSIIKYEEAFALNLIENSIKGNYQGLTFSDTDEKYQNYLNFKSKTQQQPQSKIKSALDVNQMVKERIMFDQKGGDND